MISYYVLLGMILFILGAIIRRGVYLKFFLFFSGIVYGFVPAFIIYGGSLYLPNNLKFAYSNYDYTNPGLIIYIFVCIICVIIPYLVIYRIKPLETTQKYTDNSLDHISHRLLYLISLIMLIVSSICFLLYASQFGGVFAAISSADAIRTGDLAGGSFVFLRQFIQFGNISLILFLILLVRSNHNYYSVRLLFTLALLFSILQTLTLAGRGYFLEIFIILYAILRSQGITIKKFNIGISIAMLLVIMLYGDIFFYELGNGFSGGLDAFGGERNLENILADLIKNFAHPFISLGAAVYLQNSYEQRYFIDFLYGFISLMPERIIGITVPDTIAFLNTQNVANIYKSQVPPGLIGLSFYGLSYFGIILCIIYGLVLAFFDSKFSKLRSDAIGSFIYTKTGLMLILFVMSGEPRSFLSENISYIYTFLLLLSLKLALRK